MLICYVVFIYFSGALCGMYGYFEFFHFEWLDKILGWQDTAHGCYKWAGWPKERLTLGKKKKKI